jgi:hypothetical protein
MFFLSSAHPVGAGAASTGVKRQGREANHSPKSNVEVKNGGAIPPVPHKSSWRCT